MLSTKHLDWKYEKEVRVYARLEERDTATGLYFGDFNEQLILREIVTGPLCGTTTQELEAAVRDERIAITKGRLAFNTFKVVANQRPASN